MAALTPEQRGWLKQAAQEAQDRSATLMAADEANLVPRLCRNGTRFAEATTLDLEGLRQAFAPVYAKLEQDAQTKVFIAKIQALKRSTPRDPPLPIPKSCFAHVTTKR